MAGRSDWGGNFGRVVLYFREAILADSDELALPPAKSANVSEGCVNAARHNLGRRHGSNEDMDEWESILIRPTHVSHSRIFD